MKAEAPSLFRRIVVFSIGLHIFAVCVFVAWQAMHPESAKKAGASAPSGGGGASHSEDTDEAAKPPAPTASAPVKEYDVDTQRDISFDDEDKMITPLKRKAQALQKNIDKMTTEQKLATLDSSLSVLRNSDAADIDKAVGIALKATGFSAAPAPPAIDKPLLPGETIDDSTLSVVSMKREKNKVIRTWRDAAGHSMKEEIAEADLTPEDKQILSLYERANDNPNLLPLINAVNRVGTALANQSDAKPISP